MTYLLWAIVAYVEGALVFMGWAHTWNITKGFAWPAWLLWGLLGNVQ